MRAEGLLDQMTCLMDHLTDRQEEEANFKFIEEKIARPLVDLGVEITSEQVASTWNQLFRSEFWPIISPCHTFCPD